MCIYSSMTNKFYIIYYKKCRFTVCRMCWVYRLTSITYVSLKPFIKISMKLYLILKDKTSLIFFQCFNQVMFNLLNLLIFCDLKVGSLAVRTLKFTESLKKVRNAGLSLTLVYLIYKHVKISVDEWILETIHPQKHVKFWNNIFHKFSIPKLNFGRQENANVLLFWHFADTFQPCWPCLLWTFCKLCSDLASF